MLKTIMIILMFTLIPAISALSMLCELYRDYSEMCDNLTPVCKRLMAVYTILLFITFEGVSYMILGLAFEEFQNLLSIPFTIIFAALALFICLRILAYGEKQQKEKFTRI